MQTNLSKMLLILSILGFAAMAQETGRETDGEEVTAAGPAEPGSEAGGSEPDAGRDTIEPAVSMTPAPENSRRRAAGSRVMDEIVLERTEITGNQELPKVLYIVPWQKSDPGDLTGKPVNTLLDEVLAPIDRSEFLRQVDYYGELYSTDDE